MRVEQINARCQVVPYVRRRRRCHNIVSLLEGDFAIKPGTDALLLGSANGNTYMFGMRPSTRWL